MPFTSATSTDEVVSDNSSASARLKSTLWISASFAAARALSNMVSLKSIPITFPEGPTERAAISESGATT